MNEQPTTRQLTISQAAMLIGETPEYITRLVKNGAVQARSLPAWICLIDRRSLELWAEKWHKAWEREMPVEELAMRSGHSARVIRSAIEDGSLQAEKRDGTWYIMRTDAETWLESRARSFLGFGGPGLE